MPECRTIARDAALMSGVRSMIASVTLLIAALSSASAEAEVLLNSDFSSTSWYEVWQDNEKNNNLRGEPERTRRILPDSTTAGFQPLDGPALQVTIFKGTNEGTGLSFYPRKVLGRDPSELYLRYYLRFGSDWHQAQNGKLPGFGGTYDVGGWGGQPSNGHNGWSARGKFGDPCSNGRITIASYVYHAEMSGQYGDGYPWTSGCDNGLDRNRWYGMEYYVKVNTPGQSNGILRGWIDDRLVMERTGLRFDDTGNFQIERVWMNVYHGGGSVAPQDMHIFFDNVVISDQRIGAGPTPPDPEVAPKPPGSLGVE